MVCIIRYWRYSLTYFVAVDTFYTRDPVLEVEDGVLQAVTHIHTTKPTGDILVFLDGQETIESLKKILRSKAKMEQWDMRVLPLSMGFQFQTLQEGWFAKVWFGPNGEHVAK